MTIETLMHIYNLLKQDVEKKEFAYKCEATRRDQWLENTDTRWQDANRRYPEQKACEEAYKAYRDSEEALAEFANKQWN